MGKSKVIFNGQVLMDLTGDTVKAEHLQTGITAHGADGELITGTNDWDMNTQDANAAAAEILLGKKAGVKGQMVTGSMPNNGAVTGKITTKAGKYTVPKGFHDGSGKVGIDDAEQAKLIPENIREGVTVLGVEGAMTGTEDANPQTIEVTPTAEEQVILPDAGQGYNYIAQVTVKPIPYTEIENEAGGITVTIG